MPAEPSKTPPPVTELAARILTALDMEVGQSAAAIAARLGVSGKSVSACLQTMGRRKQALDQVDQNGKRTWFLPADYYQTITEAAPAEQTDSTPDAELIPITEATVLGEQTVLVPDPLAPDGPAPAGQSTTARWHGWSFRGVMCHEVLVNDSGRVQYLEVCGNKTDPTYTTATITWTGGNSDRGYYDIAPLPASVAHDKRSGAAPDLRAAVATAARWDTPSQ